MPGDQPRDRGQRGSPGSSQPHSGAPEPTLQQLWPGYLEAGYFDGSGNLRPECVARHKMVPLVRAMANGQPKLTAHQVRRFFQHCRAIEARLRSRASNWEAEEAAFRKIDVAASDAYGKSPKKIPQLFHDFIERNVARVRSEEDFLKGFLPHFEALVGFGAPFLRDERS